MTLNNMAESFQVKALYDFEAQPGTGELSIWSNEVLTVTRQDVGEGWWEGLNSRGESGLFPAGYVEVVSSPPPPAMPPPPLPDGYAQENQTPQTAAAYPQQISQQGSFDGGDDWEDDWDDDDSVYNNQDSQAQSNQQLSYDASSNRPNDISSSKGDASGRGTVKRSFNRFSTFVKSGGEAFILGQTKISSSSDKNVTIVDTGTEIMWSPNLSPYTCCVASPKKESKLRGFKTFIAYQLTPSFNNLAVSRRYKHFDWLHERLEEKFALIPIPPLPDKQISGRYQGEFIEHRMAQLQMWVNRLCRHPVLAQSEVWIHFLSCTDAKKWKAGKRKAEKDEIGGGSSFFHSIEVPETPLDTNIVEKQIEHFGKFSTKMDDSVKQLSGKVQDQMKMCYGSYKREFQKMASSFKDFGMAFDMDTSPHSAGLTQAVKHTGDTYEEIGKLYEDQPKYDLEPMGDVLHEYKGMLSAWPDVLHVQKQALNKKREYQKLLEEGKIGSDEVSSLNNRIDVISYATLAEINHFQHERVAYFKSMMQAYLTAQIDFYQKIVQKLQDSLVMYEEA